jgi:hypothetical protein
MSYLLEQLLGYGYTARQDLTYLESAGENFSGPAQG